MKRILSWALALALALVPLCAQAAGDSQGITGGICAYSAGTLEMQEWIDGPLTEGAGSASDNYVMALRRMGADADFSGYVRAASAKLLENAISNPVSRQRCALALISCGAGALVPAGLVDESVGKLGAMSNIFGLHLINSGAPSTLWTADSLGEKILGLQKEDGGWAVTGASGDVDVTAMCLQALSGWTGENAARDAAVARALDFLSARQLESGGFASMGRENAESSAQVLIALASLNIDPESDARFLKNGRGPLDALMAYRLPSGGFSHLPGEAENDTATVQALQALVALELPGERFYDFSQAAQEPASAPRAAARGWKFWALLGVAALTLAGVALALIRRRGRIKNLLFVLVLAAGAVALLCCVDLESASGYYGADAAEDRPEAGRAYLSIRCDRVAGRSGDGSTPEDGVILPRTEFAFAEGDSVFDLLTAAARKYEIQMEHEGGSGDMAYVNGINYLYEYAYGELSGWIYSVNGEVPSVGCGSYPLKDGDEVLWQYTTELGEDLK